MIRRCAVVAALLVGLGLLAACSKDQAAAATALVPAAKAGADPFTDSVQVGPAVTLPGNVEAVSAGVRGDLKTDPKTGTLVAKGSTPGLYGGTGKTQVCDPAKLVAFLENHPAKAKAWAGVIGIRQSGIEDFVQSLTPVVLTSDTLVMNHGFRDGKATATRSVLQAGTAVMVDRTGTPRVKCNCGNPLGRAPKGEAIEDETDGAAWSGYEPAEVVSVAPATTGGTLTLTDTETGDPVEVRVGGVVPEREAPPAEAIPTMGWGYATDDENGSSTYGTQGTISGAVISDLAEDVAAALPPDDETLHGYDAIIVTANTPGGQGREYGGQDGIAVDTFGELGFRVEAEMSTPDPSSTVFGPNLTVGSEGSGASMRPVLQYEPYTVGADDNGPKRAEVPGSEGRAGSVSALTYGDGQAWAVAVYQTEDGGDARDLAILSSTDGITWKQSGPLLRAGGDTVALAYTDGALVLGAVPAAGGGGDDRIEEPITINPGTDDAEPIAGTPFDDAPVVDLDGPDGGVGNGLVAGAGHDVFISGSGRTWKKVETAPHPITAVEGAIDTSGTVTPPTAPVTPTTQPPTPSNHPCDADHIVGGLDLEPGTGSDSMECYGDYGSVTFYDLESKEALVPGFIHWDDGKGGWVFIDASMDSPLCNSEEVPIELRSFACGAG